MNKELFRSKMALHGDTYESLGKVLDVTAQTLSNKVNESGGAEFKQGEISVIKQRYSLTCEEVNDIFFAS